MKLKKRRKNDSSGLKIRSRKRPPKKRYTKGGNFIIEDKPWNERFVPCRECKHWLQSTKIYIAEDGTEGFICPIKDRPRLHTELVICKDFNDDFVVAVRKSAVTRVDKRDKISVKRRRHKNGIRSLKLKRKRLAS